MVLPGMKWFGVLLAFLILVAAGWADEWLDQQIDDLWSDEPTTKLIRWRFSRLKMNGRKL